MSEAFLPTIASLIALRAEDDSTGLALGEQTWTWRQVVRESELRAQWLRAALDFDKPPHVGVLLPNCADFVFTLLGAALAGACIVGLNPTRSDPELARDLTHTDCQLLLTDRAQAGRLPSPLVVEDTPWAGTAPSTWEPPTPDTLLLLIFTSGSTSAPKAVKRSQGAFAAGANLGFSSGDVLYSAMPLFHGNALSSTLFPSLASGATLALREKFSASQWLSDVRFHGATFANTVGRALGYILATPPTELDRDHKVRVVMAPEASPRDIEDFTARFGAMVITGYGSSEGGIVLTPTRTKGALGRSPRTSDIAVINAETNAECELAELDENGLLVNGEKAIGELVRRDSRRGFEGYWNNPEADAQRNRNGWFWSGDLAYKDAAGDFWFAGRVGDWLRVDSENFAAAPVERVLGRHPDLAAVAIVGVPDPQGGDQVLAAVEPLPGAVFDPERLADFLAAQPDLGAKWSPRFVRVCTAMPVAGNDKVDRRRIKAEAWLSSDELWWRPARAAAYTRFTDDDARALRAEFAEHGRAAAHPQAG